MGSIRQHSRGIFLMQDKNENLTDRNPLEAAKLIVMLDKCKCEKCPSEIVRLKEKYGWTNKN
jgi:hypothetical protein